MFNFNQTTNRYEATLEAGTGISISERRFEDDAHNRAVMLQSGGSYAERLEIARSIIIEHPTIYAAKHNGFSVIVTPAARKRSRKG